MDKVFKIEDLRPIRDEMTVSRNSRLSDKTPITYFSLGKGTSISQESYDNTTVYIGAKGCADFLIGDYAAKHTISEGDMLVVPSKTLCGVTTETGCIYHKSTRHFPACSHNFPKAGEARFQGLSRLFRLLGKFPYLGESRRILMAVSSKTSSKTRFYYAATRRISSAAVQPSIWA